MVYYVKFTVDTIDYYIQCNSLKEAEDYRNQLPYKATVCEEEDLWQL